MQNLNGSSAADDDGGFEVLFGTDEERLHFATHFAGVVFIAIYGWRLWHTPGLTRDLSWGIAIYVLTFLMVFLASSFYHLSYFGNHRRLLRKFDHISIYFFIAGSNTPFLLGYGEGPGIIFLCLLWGLVLFGTVIKWWEFHLPDWISLLFYLFLGWLGVVTIYLVFDRISPTTILFILLGGIFYSIGAYFYKHDSIKWYHGIWHLFVLAGAGSHFLAIYGQVR